ncbi:PQQ-binding-like beta-propeller repeat protein [Halomonas ramblicola]|uniref:PQQ-binding-like beta-propeller repeat protein n=1 Tax=Halomonas ramblicola TaxID=747349 RepID=UPI00338DF904
MGESYPEATPDGRWRRGIGARIHCSCVVCGGLVYCASLAGSALVISGPAVTRPEGRSRRAGRCLVAGAGPCSPDIVSERCRSRFMPLQ